MGIAVGISLLSCIRAEIYANTHVLPVIGRHLWFPTYLDVRQSTSFFVFPDPENMRIAVGISLLLCVRAEIYVSSCLLPVIIIIFDFRHKLTSDSLPISLSMSPVLENTGVAVGISLLSCVRAELYVISCLLTVNGRHLWFQTYTDVRQSSH